MTQEPWEMVEEAHRAELSFDQEIEAAIVRGRVAIEQVRRDCDVCLYDRHCVSHCPENCEHRCTCGAANGGNWPCACSAPDSDPYWMFR